MPTSGETRPSENTLRTAYDLRMVELRQRFEQDKDGLAFVHDRSAAVDEVLRALWSQETQASPQLGTGVTLVALGGYGRRQLFPFSDIDLLFCTQQSTSPEVAGAMRRLSQALWDCGLRSSATTRTLSECERFKPADPEGSLALLDLRFVTGDALLFGSLQTKVLEKRSSRDSRNLAAALAELTRTRHARFGHTLFHLEPNIKDAPGGLRDAHTALWLARLHEPAGGLTPSEPFREAFAFVAAVRVFLHLRHGRDDNTLDWHAQDEAAAQRIGIPVSASAHDGFAPDAAYWMRFYFRHARAIERSMEQELELSGVQPKPSRTALRAKAPSRKGFTIEEGILSFQPSRPDINPAADPEIVLAAFGIMAATGARLAPAAEERVARALPALSAALEDGPLLWAHFCRILTGRHAAAALRSMHALGFLELIVPEFHGIDALVIRDAYHRYTVDEHTFVLIEALHGLSDDPPANAPEWRLRFRTLLRDLSHPELLFLAALLHDTGKGRSDTDHARASAQLADSVTERLELDAFDRDLVHRLIEDHLEMSAALRRDIFDAETVRVFAEKLGTHDLLRMLTLFTYADISAVHPDALTPWKAENLWRLWMSAENQLDRSVDQDRIHTSGPQASREAASIARALGLRADQRTALEQFLEGAPERYLRTRSPETIRQHMQLAQAGGSTHVLLSTGEGTLEVTIITADRPRLFADLTAALAGWGMNIVTAEAFSNAAGTVIDTFRFTDRYKTLELNPEERDRFRASLEEVVSGVVPIDSLLSGRQRGRRTRPRRIVETRVEFDNMSSAQSTLMQVVAQDEPGLLRSISLILSDHGCSVEVALIDTEGEMAIDVFYLTLGGDKLNEQNQLELKRALVAHLDRKA